MTHLTLDRPHVSPDLILRLQKYKKLEAVPAPVREAAQAMAALAERLLHVLVRRVEAEGAIIVADGVRFQSRALARLLRGATEIFLILLTLGPRLENRAQALMGEEQFLEALLLDTAGWAAMDALTKTLRGRLSSEARARGMHLTHRMAPGYADWGLEEQRALFSAFGEDSLPVQLTEACVMLPRKSISGIYGLIPATTTA
ncbi:MAG: hypothetical protein HYU32_10020 [candidate division NC10 bacterium]|nr:hypothetical protein [candidate division NC10 bacterium]